MSKSAHPASTPLERTRKSLHGVAELVMAGPQFEQSHSIELRVSTGGFATTQAPEIRVEGCSLVVSSRRVAMNGHTIGELATEVGVAARSLKDVYADGSGLGADSVIDVDEESAHEIARAFELGDLAMHRLAPERPRVLWPEHFDIGLDQDDVNYGVSAGDGWCPEPYAYVGPWHFSQREDRDDPFWNAPFGTARAIRGMAGEDDLFVFFSAGRDKSALSR
jgi:hypothetical protein